MKLKNSVMLVLIFILLAYGCLNIYNVYSHPLIAAVRAGQRDAAVALLDKGAKIDDKDAHGLTALMYAAQAGHREMVEMLLNKGAHANEKDGAGQTALMLAADRVAKNISPQEKEYLNIVWLLLDRGAAVDEKDNAGQTALMRASQAGQTDVVKVLLVKGAK
jgi:ankyrin repeat protein